MKIFEKGRISERINYYRNHDLLRKLATVLSIDILVKASAFILLPVYLRLMSQEDYGLYNYLISIITAFSLILNLGFYVAQSKLYHVFDNKTERGGVLFTINSSLLVFLLVLLVIIYLFKWDYFLIDLLFKSHFPYGEYRPVLLLSLIITILSFMLTNFFYTSDKIKQVKQYNLSRIILVNTVSLTALLIFKTESVKIRFTAAYITELVLFLFFIRYLVAESVPSFDFGLLKKSLMLGLPITISAVFSLFTNYSDKFLLEKFGSLKDLSNYYLAFSFAGILAIISLSLQNVWLPAFLKEKDVTKNFDKTKKLLRKTFLLLSALSILIWIGFWMLLLLRIIPPKYDQVIFILPLVLLGQIFAALTQLYGNYLVYFEKTYLAAFSGLLVGIVCCATGFILVPKMGVYGSAISSLVSGLTYFLLYYWMAEAITRKYFLKQVKVGEVITE